MNRETQGKDLAGILTKLVEIDEAVTDGLVGNARNALFSISLISRQAKEMLFRLVCKSDLESGDEGQ